MKRIVRYVAVAVGLALFAGLSTAAQRGANFAAGHSSLGIPVEINNNLILIETQLNDKRLVKMIFDTAASVTVINADLREELGLKVAEKASGTATGGAINGEIANGVRVAVKGIEATDQPIGLFALPRVPGFDYDGIIGFDFINELVVEIDYLKKVMNLYDPKYYRYGGKGTIVPLRIQGRRTPLVDVSFLFSRRASGWLELDTGADSAILLYSHFFEKHGLLKMSKNLEATTGRGVGGHTERLLGKATRASVGPFEFRDVPILFSLQKEAVDAGIDGLVGGEILRRFKVIIDYSRSRMILEANKDLRDPFEIEG